MKSLTKILILLLIISTIFLMASCGNGPDDTSSSDTGSMSDTSDTSSTTEEPTDTTDEPTSTDSETDDSSDSNYENKNPDLGSGWSTNYT